MIPASHDIGIGITTKNRWDDLASTLTHLSNEGLDKLETIVIDDGSDRPMPADFPQRFPWVKFERFESSEGNLPRRNRLAQILSTEFYLSLDDDSFPVAGDLAKAAAWMKENPNAAALAFRIILANDPVPAAINANETPVPCKDFINCGVLHSRKIFLEVGGYETRLHFYHEEPEYSFRAFQKGYVNFGTPAVVVRHMVTPAARPHATRARYFIRNVVLMDLWFYPRPLSYARAIGHLPLLFRHLPKLRRHPLSLLRGWLEGFACYLAWGNIKTPLTREQLGKWNSRLGGHQATQSKIPL